MPAIGHRLPGVQCIGMIELNFLPGVVVDDELERTIECFDRLLCRLVHGITFPQDKVL